MSEACRKAHVSRQTFYDWKPRFEAGGYAALENFESSTPHHPRCTPVEIEQEVIGLRRERQEWGKKRIADEVAKRHNWTAQVSPHTVKRILSEAGLWCAQSQEESPSFPTPVVRTADEPGADGEH